LWSRIFNRAGLASNLCHRSLWGDAIRVVDEALALAGDRRIALADVALLLSIRARAGIGRGDPAQAQLDAQEAIACARDCGARGYEAQALIQLARALIAGLAPGDEVRAAAALDEATTINEALGITIFAPYIHAARAALSAALGDDATRERELRTAHTLFLAVGAPGRAAEIAPPIHS
jgi:hypothetical protein